MADAGVEIWRDSLNSKKSFAHIATLMNDGTSRVTPVWIDYMNGKLAANTARGRVKDKNVKAESAIAISITDPENPYCYVADQRARHARDRGRRMAHIDKMAKKFLGSEVRALFEIEPEKVSGNK